MNFKKIIFHPKTIWVLLGALAIAVRAMASPEAIENWYSRGIFLGIRSLFSLIGGWLPFALVYVLFFVLLFWSVKSLVRYPRNKKTWSGRLLDAISFLFALAGGVTFLFLVLWGYNYGRVPLEEQMGIFPEPLTISELRNELNWVTKDLIQYREAVPGSSDSTLSSTLIPAELEQTMRNLLTAELVGLGYPASAKVRGRLLYPEGLLLRISTAGVYIPFTGEGHIDPGLHHLQLPFVMAHEMGHGYGFGDEGTCNFLAYLACTRSEDAFLKYIGQLYYFRYVASDFRGYQPEEYKELYQNIPAGIKNDLQAIRNQMEKFPDIFPAARDATYNAYLRAQGIEEGLRNYNRVTLLVAAYRKRAKE